MKEKHQNWLEKLVSEDEIYQQMLKEAESLEAEYERILHSLSEEDQILLEKYISLSEEMEHRRTFLAMERKTDSLG